MSNPAMQPAPAFRPSRAQGFTLLEVLIALVVLSVGLLGIAAMMNFSLKANDSAYMRTQAQTLAYNIIDKMRANQNAALNGGYNIAIGTPVSSPPASCLTSSNVCSSANVALWDLNIWKQNLASTTNGLPCGDGGVTLKNNNGVYEITVTIQWDDSRAQNGSNLGGTTPTADCSNPTFPPFASFTTTTAL